mgnify:CR=1 FL=1
MKITNKETVFLMAVLFDLGSMIAKMYVRLDHEELLVSGERKNIRENLTNAQTIAATILELTPDEIEESRKLSSYINKMSDIMAQDTTVGEA